MTAKAKTTPAIAPQAAAGELLDHLGGVCDRRGLEDLATRLRALGEIMGPDLAACEALLAELPRRTSLVGKAATHLLDLGGKRLRPLCVALAARVGSGFGPAARELAVAVELVHSATLLHDDVVDLGELRRGASTARAVYGNAAAIFAGDWLLVDALRRVRRSGAPLEVMDRLLAVIEEMIFAESIQLENRGRVSADRDAYFRVVEGKTAALFRWAMYAGGRVGGLGDAECRALESYGLHLGVAFQAVDDLLDLTGHEGKMGKTMLADLREGKMTYPLIVALERDPELAPVVEEILARPIDEAIPATLAARVRGALEATGAIDDCRALAQGRAARAIEAIAILPASRARASLETVAEASVNRDM